MKSWLVCWNFANAESYQSFPSTEFVNEICIYTGTNNVLFFLVALVSCLNSFFKS